MHNTQTIMKLPYISIVIFSFLALFSFTVQAEPIKISLDNVLKKADIEQEISKALPGDKSVATLASANITLDGSSNIPGYVGLILQIKGKKYLIPYDFIVKTGIGFYIEQNCKVTRLNIRRQTDSGHIYDTAIFNAYWYFFETSIEKQIMLKITDKIKSIKNTQLKMLCDN